MFNRYTMEYSMNLQAFVHEVTSNTTGLAALANAARVAGTTAISASDVAVKRELSSGTADACVTCTVAKQCVSHNGTCTPAASEEATCVSYGMRWCGKVAEPESEPESEPEPEAPGSGSGSGSWFGSRSSGEPESEPESEPEPEPEPTPEPEPEPAVPPPPPIIIYVNDDHDWSDSDWVVGMYICTTFVPPPHIDHGIHLVIESL